MNTIIETCPGEGPSLGRAVPTVPPLERTLLDRHAPSAHFSMVRDNHLVARCSIWAESTPQHMDKPLGVLGHYAASDANAGAAVLVHASRALQRRGFQNIVGPMDGNTWRRYRLLTQRGSEPPFFLEPDNPDDWSSHFELAGFAPLARYFSALNDDLSVTDPRVPEAMSRLESSGVRIRTIDMSRLQDELIGVHELSLEAFAGNFLYTPITQAEFLAMYEPLRPHLKPELILLAEQDSRLIGFIFGMPDLAQAQRGISVNTVIAKSMAVRPGRSGAGLGSVLMDQFQQAARRMGFNRVIHALMHEDNRSLKISSRFGRAIRQYTLYSKDMA